MSRLALLRSAVRLIGSFPRGRRCTLIGSDIKRQLYVKSSRPLRHPLSYPLHFGRKLALYAGIVLGGCSLVSLSLLLTEDADSPTFNKIIEIEVEECNDGKQPTVYRKIFISEKDAFDEDQVVFIAQEVITVLGRAFSWGICGYLSAHTVLTKACDSLIARPFESREIFRQAGGKIGVRAAMYSALVMFVSDLVQVPPDAWASQFIFMPLFNVVAIVPSMLFAYWACSRLVGKKIGEHFLQLISSETIRGAISATQRSHALDVLCASRPRTLHVALLSVAMVSRLLPDLILPPVWFNE